MAREPLVEDCNVLDICRMKRDGRLIHGERNTGSITWRNGFSVTYEHDGGTSLTLTYPNGHRQRLRLYRMPMPLGGHRWMFRLGGDRFAFKLYCPKDGGTEFRSRAAHGLGYLSRHLGRRKRLRLREDRFFLRYGAVEVIKPHGMWHTTWESKKLALEALRAQARGAERKRVLSTSPGAVYMRHYRARLKSRGAVAPGATV